MRNNSIKTFKIPSYPKLTLGELRNLSVQYAQGEYVCQWDDDDYYSPLRLYEQYVNIIQQNKKGCILNQWLIYDYLTNNIFSSVFMSSSSSIPILIFIFFLPYFFVS